MVSKPDVCENDETTKDTKAGDDDTLVSLKLPGIRVSLR